MGVGGIRDSGSAWRTGAHVLSLLAAPLSGVILEGLSRGPRRLSELRREAGSPPPATLRGHLKKLGDIGVVAKRRLNLFPSVREYELTSLPGRELLFVATTVEGWLANAPTGPLPYGGEAGRAAIEALVEGWSSTMVHALAAGPLTMPELDRRIGSLSHTSVERCLSKMRLAGLIEVKASESKGSRSFEVTEWLRLGLAPAGAAARWERNHIPDATAPIEPIDAEAGLLLAMPLLRLPPELSGSCQVAVEFGERGERRLAGVTVEVERGRIASCTTRLEDSPRTWAIGSPAAWLRTAIEANPNRLELGGDQRLVRGLLDGLSRALFSPARPRLPRL